jgi:hypothetical protein
MGPRRSDRHRRTPTVRRLAAIVGWGTERQGAPGTRRSSGGRSHASDPIDARQQPAAPWEVASSPRWRDRAVGLLFDHREAALTPRAEEWKEDGERSPARGSRRNGDRTRDWEPEHVALAIPC